MGNPFCEHATKKDWELMLPYLQENERLFDISIEEDLLKVEGQRLNPLEVYRKVRPEEKGDTKADGLKKWGE